MRPFLDRDGAPLAIVINETFARTHFPNVDPIAKRLLMGATATRGTGAANDVAWAVVGVVADEGLSWNGAAEALMYGTREQSPSDYLSLVVRASIDPVRTQESIRKAVSTVDRDQALADVATHDELKMNFMASDRLRSAMLGVFAAIAVALAAIGLYRVLSYAVVQRGLEIGIRAALGASRGSLVALVVRQGMTMTGWGLVLGLREPHGDAAFNSPQRNCRTGAPRGSRTWADAGSATLAIYAGAGIAGQGVA